MSFARQPLLKPEVETQLKKDMSKLWSQGISGRVIATQLNFGKSGTLYEKVKPEYIYFYRQKFNLPLRQKPPFAKGESRYKNSPKKLRMLSFKEFKEKLDKYAPGKTFYEKRQRTFLILHFWGPLRVSELFERSGDDLEVQPDFVTIHLLRKKKKYKRTVDDEPLKIPRAFPLMEEVVDWLQGKQWGGPHNPRNRPWRISYQTAWRYVNEVFEGYYSHFFRFEFITQGLEDPLTNVVELVAMTGLNFITIQKYIAAGTRHQDTFNTRKLERLKSEQSV